VALLTSRPGRRIVVLGSWACGRLNSGLGSVVQIDFYGGRFVF